jgi:hypothetical protein
MEGLKVFTSTIILIQIIISTLVCIGLGLNLKQIKNVLSNDNLMTRGLIVN